MAKKEPSLVGNPRNIAYNPDDPEDIKRAMAETREAISQRIASMENLMGQQLREAVNQASERVLQTTDQLSNRVKETTELVTSRVKESSDRMRETTEHIKKSFSSSIKELQEKTDMPHRVRKEPIKTVAVAAGTGFMFGAFMANRAKKRAKLFRRELEEALPGGLKALREASQRQRQQVQQIQRHNILNRSAWLTLLSTVSLQLAQQLLQTGIVRFADQMMKKQQQKSVLNEADIQIPRQETQATM